MLSRRAFIGTLAAAPLAAQKGGPANPVGCQTNAFKDPTDLPGLLKLLEIIKSAGYAGFETNVRNTMLGDAPAAGVRQQWGGTGLRFIGPHVNLRQGVEALRPAIERTAALGGEKLVTSGAALVKEGQISEAEVKAKAAQLSQLGNLCRQHGVALTYHNHKGEFLLEAAEMEGLIRQTDPEVVSFMMDSGHVHLAGMKPGAFLRKHGRRIDCIHIRNVGPDEKRVRLGTGLPDLGELAAAIRDTQWRGWLINEPELRTADTALATASIKSDRAYMKQIF